MSSDLVIGLPGTSALTTEIEQYAQRLDGVREELYQCAARLIHTDQLVTESDLWRVDGPYSAVRAEESLVEARRLATEALVSSELLTSGLRRVVAGYEATELQLQDAHHRLSGLVGYGIGWLLPGLALLAVPLLVPSLIAGGGGLLLLPEERRRQLIEKVRALAEAKAGVLTDPLTVELVRATVTSADDTLAGLLRVPLPAAAILGEHGLGVTGIASATAAVGIAGSTAGLFVETAVRVRPVSTRSDVAPASSLKERIERIPAGDEQIRVDRYSRPGEPDRVEVYIAGTADLGTVTGTEPLDMTSNLHAMAGGSAGSARAVGAALRDAGVTSDTPIVFTGYSQGGLVAAQLAASGEWNTVALVTAGAPAGQVAVSRDIPYLALEHTDDLVPALGGRFESSGPLLVRHEFFAGPVDTSQALLPAHELENYVHTAGLADREPDTRIHGILSHLDATGATVTSTTYRAERLPGGESD